MKIPKPWNKVSTCYTSGVSWRVPALHGDDVIAIKYHSLVLPTPLTASITVTLVMAVALVRISSLAAESWADIRRKPE